MLTRKFSRTVALAGRLQRDVTGDALNSFVVHWMCCLVIAIQRTYWERDEHKKRSWWSRGVMIGLRRQCTFRSESRNIIQSRSCLQMSIHVNGLTQKLLILSKPFCGWHRVNILTILVCTGRPGIRCRHSVAPANTGDKRCLQTPVHFEPVMYLNFQKGTARCDFVRNQRQIQSLPLTMNISNAAYGYPLTGCCWRVSFRR